MRHQARAVSGVERLWLAADRIAAPFVNQLVIEGVGDGMEPSDVAAAVAALAESQPGCTVRLQGGEWTVSGTPPEVRSCHGEGWDGLGPDGAGFLRDPLPPESRTCEVLVVRGDPDRLVLRTHHASMDGRGTLIAARGLFEALRGQEPTRAEAGPTTDADLARLSGRPAERAPVQDCPAPVRGVCGGASRGTTWRRVRLSVSPRGMLPRLAVAVAELAGTPCRVDIPVDLRAFQPTLSSTANLTGLVRLSVRPGDDIDDVNGRLRAGVASGEASDFVLAAASLRPLPLALMAAGGRAAAVRSLTLARYTTTATLSNLGRLDLADLSAPGFEARSAFFIPPGNPGLPLFVALAGTGEGLDLCATMPMALASHGRIEAVVASLAEAIG